MIIMPETMRIIDKNKIPLQLFSYNGVTYGVSYNRLSGISPFDSSVKITRIFLEDRYSHEPC